MFKISREANKWCDKIGVSTGNGKGAIKTKLDFFYLAALIGFASGRAQPLASAESMDITDKWTSDFQEYRDLMIGILVAMDFKNKGLMVSLKTKEIVKKDLLNMININSSTRMAESAVSLLNSFSNGGFEVMREKRGALLPPENQIAFLQWYLEKFMSEYFSSTK